MENKSQQFSLFELCYVILTKKLRMFGSVRSSEAASPTRMICVEFLMSIGNWSVSQPRSGDPVFESMEPSMPNLKHYTETF